MAVEKEPLQQFIDATIEEVGVPLGLGGILLGAELAKLADESMHGGDVIMFGVGGFFAVGAISMVYNRVRDRFHQT